MHYNTQKERDRLMADYERLHGRSMFEGQTKSLCIWINLCLSPYTWEQTYAAVRRKNTHIPYKSWECLGGAIMALFVNINRFTPHTAEMVQECIPDFVEYIRGDSVGDPWKFILSMRRYLPRYVVLKSLAKVGIDWRKVAVERMGAKVASRSSTYHSLFTNLYVRSIVKAMVCFRLYRSVGDPDYLPGTNDLPSLVEKESASKKCVSADKLMQVVELLQETLPSWTPAVRARACFYVSYMLPLYFLKEKQMLPSVERRVLGSGARD
jgi:hypothetical protein